MTPVFCIIYHAFHLSFMFTVGFVCGLGDVIAQAFIEKRQLKNYNVHRTVTMTAIGFLFTVSIHVYILFFLPLIYFNVDHNFMTLSQYDFVKGSCA